MQLEWNTKCYWIQLSVQSLSALVKNNELGRQLKEMNCVCYGEIVCMY